MLMELMEVCVEMVDAVSLRFHTIWESLIKKSPHGYISALILCNSYIKYLSESKLYGTSKGKQLLKDLADQQYPIQISQLFSWLLIVVYPD